MAEALLRGAEDLDPAAVPTLRPYRVALGRLLPSWGPTSEPEPALDPVLVLGEGVVRVLRHLAADRGCLVLLEDLHWADADTVVLVEYLAGRICDLPILLAASARDDEPGSFVAARLIATPAITTFPVGRLKQADVAALITSCAGDRLTAEHVDALAARADGLPLLAEELANASIHGEPSAGGPPAAVVPDAFARIVTRRLEKMSPGSRRILAAAALAGTDPDWALLPRVVGEPEDAVLDVARAAASAFLLCSEGGELRWRHALIRDAVLATLLPPERSVFARRWAEALLGRSGPGAAAHAAELLAQGGDRDRAAACLLDLARHERARGALRRAEQLLGRAEALGAPTPALALERVAVLSLSGQVGTALELGDMALPAATGEEHAQLCLLLARAAVGVARWSDAEAYVDRAGRPDDPRSLVLVADAAYGAGDVSRRGPPGRVSRRAGRPWSAPAVLCDSLDVFGRVRRLEEAAAAKVVFRRAAQVSAEHGLVPQRIAALLGLATVELLESETSTSLMQARDLALEAGLLAQASGAEVIMLDHIILEQGPRAGQDLARDLLERGARLRLPEVRVAGALGIALARASAGDTVGMDAALVALGEAAGLPEAVALAPAVRALPRLLAHDLTGATALLDTGMAPLVEHRAAAPLHHFGLWALLRTVINDRAQDARQAVRSVPACRRPANRAALAYAEAVAAGRPAGPRMPSHCSPPVTAMSRACPGCTDYCACWSSRRRLSTAGAIQCRCCASISPSTSWQASTSWLEPAVTCCDAAALRPDVAAGAHRWPRHCGPPA